MYILRVYSIIYMYVIKIAILLRVNLIFSMSHADFNGLPLTYGMSSPQYVPSPYGAWLAISDTPSQDSFSDWFRLVPDTNYEFNSTLVLRGYFSEGTHRYDTTRVFLSVYGSFAATSGILIMLYQF